MRFERELRISPPSGNPGKLGQKQFSTVRTPQNQEQEESIARLVG